MRALQLDFIRGIAILLMILFHLCFDLNNFHFIHIDIYHAKGWAHFRTIILILFLTSVGISLVLANKVKIDFQKAKKRFFRLASASLVITIATYFIFPKTYIYFGVLHFITLASVLGLAFVRHEYIALILGLSIIILFNLHYISLQSLFVFVQPILNLPLKTEDLVPIIPWFSAVLLGIFIAHKNWHLFWLPRNSFTKGIGYLGKHALFIYLVHQVILFSLIATADYLLH